MTDPVSCRTHFASKPVALDRSRQYPQREVGFYEKPHGLWYSAPCDEDGWEHWCRAEEFNLDGLAARHSVLVDFSRVLAIREERDLVLFADEYMTATHHDGMVVQRWSRGIDWKAVAFDFSGIEIAPYRWESRLREGRDWYYGWDCASGCVWDLTAILAFS